MHFLFEHLMTSSSNSRVESQFHWQNVGTATCILGKSSEIPHTAHHKKLAAAFKVNLWSVTPLPL